MARGPRRTPRTTNLWLALLWLAWLLLPISSLRGQYTFRSWQSEDGLPVNLVRSVVQAADGHIWVATAEGITRFDGIDFERIETPPGFGFPNAGPNRLFATADGAVWFASARGGLLRVTQTSGTLVWPDAEAATAPPVTQLGDWPNHGVTTRRGTDFRSQR